MNLDDSGSEILGQAEPSLPLDCPNPEESGILARHSPCKINLLLNILGRRADTFHELETVLLPIDICDVLQFSRAPRGIALTCSDPALPADGANLVHRAATAFLKKSGMTEGVCIHLDKRIPLAAGLGGGSSNAATTLLALNDLFDAPLTAADLCQIAAALGSDVPFFLQSKPALATGRGERITPLENFPALHGVHLLLIYPGFGVSTAWAYQQLARYPNALNGRPGRAQQLIELLQTGRLAKASGAFYNALEAPVLAKFPLLALFQEFLRQRGAIVALMSGSGSATFALLPNRAEAERMRDEFNAKFGNSFWTAVVPI